ncbi:hypothetical protein PO25_17215 [Vibrio anguillarum]|uniref:hypothetical protein n=1 Tax=Vibrio anguillarum TaxID=55601 RepID=UPI001AD7F563|nr:hypothetical protein [Vibrio anguillarum]MBT2949616.1 hypothetical protein [Vibrio anguillarum]
MMKVQSLVMTTLRSVATAFPVGSSIVNAWNEIQSTKENERLNQFVTSLSSRVEELEQKICKTQEEMADLFSKAMNYVSKDPKQDHIQLYVESIVLFGLGQIEAQDAENVMQQLETINKTDIETLKAMSPSGRVDERLNLDENSPMKRIEELQISIKKLESKALLAQGGRNTYELRRVYSDSEQWPYSFFIQEYVVLSSGRRLLEIVHSTKNA